jgi:hypothetical protein
VLSYVGGPALLTNATASFIVSTSNRFARVEDRARFLADKLSGERGPVRARFQLEMPEVPHRVLLIGGAPVCFCLADTPFAIAILVSIVAAVLMEERTKRRLFSSPAHLSTPLVSAPLLPAPVYWLWKAALAVHSLSPEYAEAISIVARKDI